MRQGLQGYDQVTKVECIDIKGKVKWRETLLKNCLVHIEEWNKEGEKVRDEIIPHKSHRR